MIQVKKRTTVALLFTPNLSIHISILGKGLYKMTCKHALAFKVNKFILDYREYMISCKRDYNICQPETYQKSKICIYTANSAIFTETPLRNMKKKKRRYRGD